MIITMKRDVKLSSIESVIAILERNHWDVQVRKGENGEPVVIAALGSGSHLLGPEEVKRLSVVEDCDVSNEEFTKYNGKGFLEAWEWERMARARKAQKASS